MTTIYFYGIDNNKGGIENYSLNLIRGIINNSNEFKFHIITEYENFAFKDIFVNQLKCQYTVIPNKKKHPFRYYKTLKNILTQKSPNDLLQLNIMSYRNFLLFKAAKKSKIKTIIVGHANNSNNIINKAVHYFFRLFYKNFGSKIANNSSVRNFLYSSKNKYVEIIELGINKEKFSFNPQIRNEIRDQLGCENNFVIGQIGRICKAKNQNFSLKVMSLLKNNTNISLFLIGNESSSNIKKKINKMNLKNVYFLGEKTNISDYYNSFDLFIFPSLFESAGFALYEATSNGLYSLTSKNIPLENITLNKSKQLELKPKIWAKEIQKILNTGYEREKNTSLIPTLDNQINKYLNFYLKLTKNFK